MRAALGYFAGALFLAPLFPNLAAAEWPAFGRPLSVAGGDQLGPSIVSDGAEGALVTWLDRRAFPLNIEVQHVLASGEVDAVWPTDGRALLTDALLQTIVPTGQEFPAIAADGTGGAIVTWPDARTSLHELDIYAQHILASGTPDRRWPVNGTAVCTANGSQGIPLVVSDGTGGAIITWVDGRAGATGNDQDIFAQHVLASGLVDPHWPVNGTPLCTAPKAQVLGGIVGDGAGGAIATWTDFRSGNPGADIYAQHILGSGLVDPAWPVNGLGLSTAPGTQAGPNMVSDGAHGAIVTWTDARDGNNHIYAQRVLVSGVLAAGWPIDGQAISTSGIDEVSPVLASDGAGGAIIAWGDARTGIRNIRAQHVLASGVMDPAWPVSGRPLSIASSQETGQAIASDGIGGAIVTWQLNFDIFAQHVLASGALDPAYPTDGRAVCVFPDLQQEPAIVEAGARGAIVTWMDRRNGKDRDIYALQVLEAGTTDVGSGLAPRDIAFAPPTPNPAHGAVTLRFAQRRAAGVRLGIYDVAGNQVRQLVLGPHPAGERVIAWDFRDDAGRAVGAGLYFARLEMDGQVLTRKLTKLK